MEINRDNFGTNELVPELPGKVGTLVHPQELAKK
jgi:hypothetical protein